MNLDQEGKPQMTKTTPGGGSRRRTGGLGPAPRVSAGNFQRDH